MFLEARVDAATGCAQLGWISDSFVTSPPPPDGGDDDDAAAPSGGPPTSGVGDDARSWAVDGLRRVAWHGGGKLAFGASWTTGDVIGVAADLDEGRLLFGHNGAWTCVFEGLSLATASGGLAPALSASRGFCTTLNLGCGGTPFAFGPPDETYVDVHAALGCALEATARTSHHGHASKERGLPPV